MQDFLIQSLIASVVLTVLINVIPRLFPNATRKVERQIHEKIEQGIADQEDGGRPKVKVFFPWKTMLVISVILTVLVNVLGRFG